MEENIEAPKAALPVKPGHLWCERSDIEYAEEASFQTAGDLRMQKLLRKVHTDLAERLERQDELLTRMISSFIIRKPQPPPVSEASRASSTKNSCVVDTRPADILSNDSGTHAPVGSPTFHRLSFGPKIFSTFQDYDHALFDVASNADGRMSRARFAAQAFVGGGDEMGKRDCCGPISRCVRRIVRRSYFDMFCACVVVTNSVFLGIEVEMSMTHPDGLPAAMIAIQYTYAAWFLTEVLMRITAFGSQFFFSDDWAWNLLDLFVVVTSLWEVFTDIILALQQDSMGDVNSLTGFKAFRIVRLTRIVKVVRLMRVFRFVAAFRTLIASIADTLKSLFWALMLLVVIVYVFAVLFTQAVNDYLADEENPILPDIELEAAQAYYGSLLDTMLVLFMSISNGISWHQMLAPLKFISPAWVLLFLFYIFFTYFAVLNVVTAVFCQSAMESAQNDHAAMVHSVLKNQKAHITKIKQLFSKIGDEHTGTITFARFEEKITSPAVRAYFEVLGLDVWDAWSFFKLLDLEKGGDVKIEEFLMGCLRLRGSARAIDVGKLIHDQTWLIRNQGKFQTFVEVELQKLQEQMAWITGVRMNGPVMPKRDSVRSRGSDEHEKTEAKLRDILRENSGWLLNDAYDG